MRSLQASDQMADNRLGAIYFRQLEVGTVGQVGSNLGSGQDNFPAIKDNYFDILAAVKRTAIPHHATFLGWSRQRG